MNDQTEAFRTSSQQNLFQLELLAYAVAPSANTTNLVSALFGSARFVEHGNSQYLEISQINQLPPDNKTPPSQSDKG